MRGLSLLLLPAVLMAQRPPASPADAFDRELKRNRFGTWLVLEDEGAAWGAAMRAALDEEPMVLLNLPLKVVAGGKRPDALVEELRQRFGWAKGAHWALLDERGQVRAEGAASPTAAALARAAEQGGLSSRIQELETFLRSNPERLDARAALLREYLTVASRRTRKALGLAALVPNEGETPMTPDSPKPTPLPPPKSLEPELDLKVWAAAAQHLDTLLRQARGPLPGIVGFRVNLDLRRSLAEHSPAMVVMLGRHRAVLEESLRRHPGDDFAWDLWITASGKCGGWPIQSLLASLQPLPGTQPGVWPPSNILREYLKEARSRGDWAAIREVLEPRWAGIRDGIAEGWLDHRETAFLWDHLLGPLTEAQVIQGDVGAADQLLGEAAEVAGWPGLPARARDLAMRLKRPDLAARWGALAVKGR